MKFLLSPQAPLAASLPVTLRTRLCLLCSPSPRLLHPHTLHPPPREAERAPMPRTRRTHPKTKKLPLQTRKWPSCRRSSNASTRSPIRCSSWARPAVLPRHALVFPARPSCRLRPAASSCRLDRKALRKPPLRAMLLLLRRARRSCSRAVSTRRERRWISLTRRRWTLCTTRRATWPATKAEASPREPSPSYSVSSGLIRR
mmetsp:Transcript_55545/g.97305  ORF Transcript_55545/g.97305 Transcript_55545/m.97305 type:complete len:201 (+) Transcript_55545:978-1580(+)